MPLNGLQVIVAGIYLILFGMLVVFFEIRLNYIHRKHVEKIWPIGERGLQMVDSQLRLIVRVLFGLLLLASLSVIIILLR